MEGVGARLGRSSTRYGPATVFNGPVRKWKKKWVHVSPSSNTTTTTNHSHNATACTFTNNASHLKLYKWTPISHTADKDSSKDDTPPPLEEPRRRKFKYIPIAVLEEQRNEDAENEAAEKAEEEANKLSNSHQKDAMEEKPDINDVPMDDNEEEDNKQLVRQDLNKSTLDLSLGLNGHDGDSESKADHTRDGHDRLLAIGSSLKDSSCVGDDTPYHKLVNMIMGYLSGPSPHIKSGAVSALSVLVHNDPDICVSMPELVPSILSLLKGKALEVVKAVLGFVKVLALCLQPKDLQNLLSDVVNGVLPWSTVSRNHFRLKVTTILEIILRKCGSPAVKLVTPERYNNFIKTVLENRQNKSSKDTDTADMELTHADSNTERGSHERRQNENGSKESWKRKRDSGTMNESDPKEKWKRTRGNENDSKGNWKRRETPQNAKSGSNEHHHSFTGSGGKRSRDSNYDRSMKGKSEAMGSKSPRSFNRGPTSDGKAKTGKPNMGRKGSAGDSRPQKHMKHKFGGKGRK